MASSIPMVITDLCAKLKLFFSEGANAWSDKVCSRNIDSPFGHNGDIECWAVYILAHNEKSRLEGFQNR